MVRELEQFGWSRVESVFSAEELTPIIHQVRFFASKLELDPGRITLTDRDDSGALAPRKLTEPFFRDPCLRRLVFDRRLLRYIEPVTGPQPDLILDHVFIKPAKIGSEKPWHQDDYYFRIEPRAAGLSAWIALCDADDENGCLRYISGSHTQGLLEHRQISGEPGSAHVSLDREDLDEPVTVPVRTGDVIFHHFHTIHGSGPNSTDHDRLGYATHWIGRVIAASGPSWPNAYHLREKYHELLEQESLRNR